MKEYKFKQNQLEVIKDNLIFAKDSYEYLIKIEFYNDSIPKWSKENYVRTIGEIDGILELIKIKEGV